MFDSKSRTNDIKLVLFDLEGVLLTDSSIDVDDLLSDLSSFINDLKKYDVKFGIVTGSEENNLLKIFRERLNIDVLSSNIDKVSLAEKLVDKYKISFKNVFYVGNEMFDLPLLQKSGYSAAPAESRREVKRSVNFVIREKGHKGLFKEVLNKVKFLYAAE